MSFMKLCKCDRSLACFIVCAHTSNRDRDKSEEQEEEEVRRRGTLYKTSTPGRTSDRIAGEVSTGRCGPSIIAYREGRIRVREKRIRLIGHDAA